MPKRTVEQMCDDLYDDEDVKKHVLEGVEKAGTRDLIEQGKSVLPRPKDARHAYHRATGKLGKSQRELALEEITKRQDERLAALESKLAALGQQPEKVK